MKLDWFVSKSTSMWTPSRLKVENLTRKYTPRRKQCWNEFPSVKTSYRATEVIVVNVFRNSFEVGRPNTVLYIGGEFEMLHSFPNAPKRIGILTLENLSASQVRGRTRWTKTPLTTPPKSNTNEMNSRTTVQLKFWTESSPLSHMSMMILVAARNTKKRLSAPVVIVKSEGRDKQPSGEKQTCTERTEAVWREWGVEIESITS